MSMSSGSRPPLMRGFQSSQQSSRQAATSTLLALSPVSQSTDLYGSLPVDLPLSLSSVKREASPAPDLSGMPFSGAPSAEFTHASSLPSTLPALPFQRPLLSEKHDAGMNQFIEHWFVLSKESAKQITDLSLLMTLDQDYIVTFQPHSYHIVLDAEVGQHNWFRAQACTCSSYKHGFDKVRRPATIRVSKGLAKCLSMDIDGS